MIPVNEELDLLFDLVHPVGIEEVPLSDASGRVLAQDLIAKRTQPPFAASAMDGYAVSGGAPALGARFRLVGESAAGHGWAGRLVAGECVRIFTGAPVPEGADFVVIQEDTTRISSEVTIARAPGAEANIRPAGADFHQGHQFSSPRRLRPADIALLAAMNHARLPVRRRPSVALISTGDELVMPGEAPGPDQIIASNTFGLKAMLKEEGCRARILPIARDTDAAIAQAFDLAQSADLIVTIGGASVGDHDLVAGVAAQEGAMQSFHKVAMRPGKPLMGGRLGGAMMIGLPGNPVSAMVCGHVFVLPVVRAMMGLPATPAPRLRAQLGRAVKANGPREHYMRAVVENGAIADCEDQDSALLSVLSQANALMVRPVGDEARAAGDWVEYIAI